MSLDRLIDAIAQKNNPTVAGLDPTLDYVPAFVRQESYERLGQTPEGAADAILTFNKALIDALYDIVPAVKPQCAFYELLGWPGVRALCDTIAYARQKGLFVITDGKRGDIGSTMSAYAAAHLGEVEIENVSFAPFGSDALTVNGYLGSDGILPLLAVCRERDKGMFVLCKTSNPSSGELQDQLIDGTPVYERMGELCEQWGEDNISPRTGYSAVGAVVGATYPEQLAVLRHMLPHTFFLVPGYGAQGGSAAAVAGAFDKQGRGAVVNSSRAIMCAYKKTGDDRNYAEAARQEALRMRNEINQAVFG